MVRTHSSLEQLLSRLSLLMQLVNMLLTYDFTVRADGPNLIENLILWTYGLVIILLGLVVVALHSIERLAIQKSQDREADSASPTSHQTPLLVKRPDTNADERAERAESIAHSTGNVALLALATMLLAVNILIVPRRGTEVGDRSSWFWFWIMPMPTKLSEGPSLPINSQSSMISQYTALK